jgi:hypothetical protein
MTTFVTDFRVSNRYCDCFEKVDLFYLARGGGGAEEEFLFAWGGI